MATSVAINYIIDVWQASKYHYVKSVRIRSFSGLHFPAFGLNTERYRVVFLVRIFLYSVSMWTNTDQEYFKRLVAAIFCFICVSILYSCKKNNKNLVFMVRNFLRIYFRDSVLLILNIFPKTLCRTGNLWNWILVII